MKRILIALICLLVGAVVIKDGVSAFLAARQSSTWPTVPGIVQSSAPVERTAAQTHFFNSGDYWAAVYYQYTLAGVRHLGNNVSFGSNHYYSNYPSITEVTGRYPKGSAVTVYYDPADLKRSVLEPGVHGNHWLGLLAGGALILLGVLALIIGRTDAQANIEM